MIVQLEHIEVAKLGLVSAIGVIGGERLGIGNEN